MSDESNGNKIRQEKLKALQLTLDKIEKGYGKGTIMKLGDNAIEDIAFILANAHPAVINAGRYANQPRAMLAEINLIYHTTGG